MRVTLAQINTTVGDVRGNVEKAVDALKPAHKHRPTPRRILRDRV